MSQEPTARRPIRLFRNEFFERSTHSPPGLFVMVWASLLLILGVVCLRLQPIVPSVLVALAGLLFWTLFEYGVHRFLFHLQPRSRLGQRLIFLVHENHHVDPSDPLRNIMPLGVSLTLGALICGGLVLLFGRPGLPGFLGFGLGYFLYDATHYACHQLPMRGTILSRVRQHHLRHHHAGQDANYAITAIFWDRVFGSGLVSRQVLASRKAEHADRT